MRISTFEHVVFNLKCYNYYKKNLAVVATELFLEKVRKYGVFED